MSAYYSARIIENGKARQVDCCGYKPADALLYLLQHAHIRKGATVQLGYAFWVGDTHQHMPELDKAGGSAWHIVDTLLPSQNR